MFDGSIAVIATGGVPAYSYSLNGGPSQPGNVFAGLASGTYVVTVADANGCTDTVHTIVGNSYAVTGSLLNQTNVSCFGGADGTVSVQLSGGVPPYSYSINGFTFQPTSTFTGLTAGNYTVILRDSKGCTAFVPVSISQPGLLTITIDSLQNVLCSGQAQGGIFIHVNGGTGPYSFSWSNSATTQNVTNLGAGTFNVTVIDAKGCNSSSGATISQPLPLFLNIAGYSNLSCYNDSSGYIYVNADGGMPSYSYTWSNGDVTQDISGLSQGNYSLTVHDMNGCQQTISQTINQPLQLGSGIAGTNVTCSGASNGSVTLTVTGGTPAYSYFWSNGQTTQNLSNVPGGNYSVVIHDANNCSIVNNFNVTQPQPVNVGVNITNVSCSGGSNGVVSLTVTGGTPAYSYAWNTGQTDSIQTGLGSGIYVITVTDSHACSVVSTINLINPPAIGDNFVVKNPLCHGDSNGVINLIPSGGEPPFTFLWSNQDTSGHIANLTAGTYFVTITDLRGCGITDSVKVLNPAVFYTSGNIKNVSCFGNMDGAVYVTVYGGTLPYDYYWSTHASTQNLVNVSGGNYYLTITDANGCQVSSLYIIGEPAPLTLSLTATSVSCFGGSNGSVTAIPGGGKIPYSFVWRNVASGASQTGIPAGLYGLELVDSNGCNVFDSILVTQATPVQISGHVTNVACFGGSSGSVTLATTGGTPAYNFAWSNGASASNLNNVVADTYRVTVTDASSCTVADSFNIQQGTEMIIELAANPPVCYGANTGFISASVSGGIPPYRYLWSTTPSDTGMLAYHLNAGDYNLTITDNQGCTGTSGTQLMQPQPLSITALSSGSRCVSSGSGMVVAIPAEVHRLITIY